MKIRTLFITAASVIVLSSAAMADDHLVNALAHGLAGKPDSPALNDHGQGQGSPFMGEDTHTPASATAEEKPNVNIKERCPPGTTDPRCLRLP